MRQNKGIVIAIIIALAPLALSAVHAAQQSEAQIWAVKTGEAAGAARFCKLDEDLVEKFELRAAARMAKVALDDIDVAVARVTYKNALAVAASRGPAGGCDSFAKSFDDLLTAMKPLSPDTERPDSPKS